MHQRFRSTTRHLWAALRWGALKVRSFTDRPAHRPPAWESDVLDDIAFNRPWNLVVKALRVKALIVRPKLRTGATIVIVNWNTLAVTKDTIRAVKALTPRTVELLVVDNGSTDGSREWLRNQPDLRLVALPLNAGHAIALDIAMLLVRTKVAVTLDSDAVPLTNDWLDTVVEPLRRQGVVLAGLRSSRNFVHPVFSAVDVKAFAERRLSFQVWQLPSITDDQRVWGENTWDTAELMTRRLKPEEVVFVDRTENPIPGLPGMTTGGAVYHHGGVTRATEAAGPGLVDASYHDWVTALNAILPEAARP